MYSKKGEALPMSLLKLPSLLSNPSWTMISSTLNICSFDESLSLSAFFPRTTEKRRLFWWDLKYKFTRQSDWLTQHLLKPSVRRHFPPIRKAVGSCQDPTCRDQTPATAKHALLALASPEDGSHPWVGFHCSNGSANNLHLPPPGATATGGARGCEAKNKLNVAQNVRG